MKRELPGHDLIDKGIEDLEQRIESVESFLVSIGHPRLSRLGLRLPAPLSDPEHRLYLLLAQTDEDTAHAQYNAFIRRLVSYERAAECAS